MRAVSIFLKKLRSFIFYSLSNRFSSKKGIDPNSDVIVSLTTFPARTGVVHLAIESLLNQTHKPRRIILWLSKEQYKDGDLPATLTRQMNRGLEVCYVEKDLRPYKKLYYALEEYFEQDVKIITTDDDVYYPRTSIQELVEKSEKYPDCVIGRRAKWMELKDDANLTSYNDWKGPQNGEPSHHVFPTGVCGVLYKPSFFDKEFFKVETFMSLCASNDDIWFKAMAMRNGKMAAIAKDQNADTLTIKGSQEESLMQQNVIGRENDEHLKKVFHHYDLYKQLN